jgi:small conductance mechanosensitive channel
MEAIKNWAMNQGLNLATRVLAAVILICVGVLIITIIMKIVKKALTKSKLEKAAHTLIRSLLRTVLYVLLALIVAASLGIDVTGIVALASVLTLAVSLALQDALTNLIGGFTLLYTQPFHSGDYVEIADKSGTVTEIGMTYTKLSTPDNKIISIPNGAVTSAEIVNYSTTGTRRLSFDVHVSYDAPVQAVLDTLLALAQDDRVLHEPAEPFAGVSSYGESTVVYVLRVWVKSDDYWDLNFDINKKLRDALAEKGIEMTYPHLNVHLEK